MAEAEYRLIFYEAAPVVINIIKIAGMSLGHRKISVQFLGFGGGNIGILYSKRTSHASAVAGVQLYEF
ncbi:hypothetical protein, partial [Longicatena sp. 210702-DFI.1.204]|uniref:hypothetical protein n=1 Tax=Longicatena sp. 210702-DFI.1.204 TaxID=2883224 RepID=UPI001D1228EA